MTKTTDVSDAGGARLEDSEPLEIPGADVVQLRPDMTGKTPLDPDWVDEPEETKGGNGSTDPSGQAATAFEPAFPQTETGLAERLVRDHGRDLHFCHPWQKWLHWDDGRWELDATASVQRLVKATVRGIYAEASKIEDDDLRKSRAKFARESESAKARRAAASLATSELGIPVLPEELDRDPMLLNAPNGTIDLHTGELRPHRREDLLTKIVSVAYNPDAVCPTFERFLLEVLGDDLELLGYMQRLLGYAITGEIREHVLPFFYGGGCNGKSTLLNAVRDVLGGDYSSEVMPGLLMLRKYEAHTTELAHLHGKRLCTTVEVEEGRRLAEVMVKQLTGGDQITARRMREDPWSFKPTHTIILAANHKPEVRGTDRAIWRRIHLVPFGVSFEGREDKHLPAKLRAEAEGILAWLVRGCLAWQKAGGLNPPTEVLAATEQYREESDCIGDFLADCCVTEPNCKAKAGELYATFTAWHEKAVGGDAMSQQAFGRRLSSRGFVSHRTESTRQWLKIGLRNTKAAEQPDLPLPNDG